MVITVDFQEKDGQLVCSGLDDFLTPPAPAFGRPWDRRLRDTVRPWHLHQGRENLLFCFVYFTLGLTPCLLGGLYCVKLCLHRPKKTQKITIRLLENQLCYSSSVRAPP
jgi:hypothetical protein